MTDSPSAWTPDPYTTDAELRSDGCILLRPRKSLELR